MSYAWKNEKRICKYPECNISFTPVTSRQEFHNRECKRLSMLKTQRAKKCAYKHCETVFTPLTSRGMYCSPECNKHGRSPQILEAAKASNLRKKKFAYKGDAEFRLIAESRIILKCTQKCIIGCRIKGMRNLGCIID